MYSSNTIRLHVAVVLALALKVAFAQDGTSSILSADITNRSGVKTTIKGLQLSRNTEPQTRPRLLTYVGVPTETKIPVQALPLFTGDLIAHIPLSTIKSVEVKMRNPIPSDNDGPFDIAMITLALSTGSSVTGEIGHLAYGAGNYVFSGATDLGVFSITATDISAAILNSVGNPVRPANPKGPGAESAVLVLANNKEIKIRETAFLTEEHNSNGAFTGVKYPMSVKFSEGEAKYEISLAKITAFEFETSERQRKFWRVRSKKPKVTLISSSGKKLTGEIEADGIEGVAEISGLQVRVVVPFFSKAESLRIGK